MSVAVQNTEGLQEHVDFLSVRNGAINSEKTASDQASTASDLSNSVSDQASTVNTAEENTTHKELRHMSRSELVEVIYALEKDLEKLECENKKLQAEVDDKYIRIETSGSIAEAALSLNHIFEDAQAAADQYLDSLKHDRHSDEETVEETLTAVHGRHAL